MQLYLLDTLNAAHFLKRDGLGIIQTAEPHHVRRLRSTDLASRLACASPHIVLHFFVGHRLRQSITTAATVAQCGTWWVQDGEGHPLLSQSSSWHTIVFSSTYLFASDLESLDRTAGGAAPSDLSIPCSKSRNRSQENLFDIILLIAPGYQLSSWLAAHRSPRRFLQ